MAGAPGKTISEPMNNICAIVEDRDKTIRETDIRIEYYKNALEKVLNEIKNLEKEKNKIAEEYKFVQKQNEQLDFIRTSLEGSQEVARQSLVNHQYFEQIVAKELKIKEKKMDRVEQECRNLYNEAQEKLNQNPFYRKLEEQKVEFLKLDIIRRDLEVKIRQRKKINTQKKEIEEKFFYIFFVKMAEEYLIHQYTKELEKLRTEELEAVRRLYVVQEEVKIRQKLGAPRDNIKRMANITFGSQDNRTENLQNRVVAPQQKKETKVFNEKLNNMFQQDELKNVTYSKVHILSQKMITPAFVTQNFALAEKRKNKSIDLSRKWQKIMRNTSFAKGANGRASSRRSENQLSQSSQQSQLSQPEPLTTVTPVVDQHSIKNTDASKQLIQPQESQGILIEMEKVPIQYQVIENMKIGAEQFKPECPIVSGEATRYELDKCYKPTSENIVICKPITQPQETQRLPIHMREKVAYQMVENMNLGTGHLNVEIPQTTLLPPALQEHPISRGEKIQNRISSTPDMPYTRSSVSKCEMVPKNAVSEQCKSVRFNLEQTNHQTETKSLFGGQSIFGNMFSPFAIPAPNQNEIMMTGANNATFNTSLVDQTGENSHIGLDFDSGENGHTKNLEYSYELERGVQQPFKPPEMPSFGGGFFSFGKNMFNPF